MKSTKRGYSTCKVCGKEVIHVVAKNRKGHCYTCWTRRQHERTAKKYPYHVLRNEEDLLRAAYESAPWILKVLRVSLPSWLVHRDLRNSYRQFLKELQPGDYVCPFHFNRYSLAMRQGFLIIRSGQPLRVWITALS